MTTTWWCLQCDERGTTDRQAEAHTKATQHATVVSTVP